MEELQRGCAEDRLFLLTCPYNGRPWAANLYLTNESASTEVQKAFAKSARKAQIFHVLISGRDLDERLKALGTRLERQSLTNPFLRFLVELWKRYSLQRKNVAPTANFPEYRPARERSYGDWDAYYYEYGLGLVLESRFEDSLQDARDGDGFYVAFPDTFDAAAQHYRAYAFIARFKDEPDKPRLV